MTHLKQYWRGNLPFDNENEVMRCLPGHLKRKITRHCDRSHFIDQMEMFSDLNAYIRGLIALKMRAVSCASDRFLYRDAQWGKTMYFQRTGRSLIHNQLTNEIVESGRGTCIGC